MPGLMAPCSSASQSASGIAAAEVFAYLSIQTTTLSMGKFRRLANASMILRLA